MEGSHPDKLRLVPDGCVELLLRDGRMISIDCTGVEDALDVTMAQRSELDYLIYTTRWAMPI